MNEVWITSLRIDFDDFTSQFTELSFSLRRYRYIKQSRLFHQLSKHRCACYFRLSSQCLDILIKCCLECLV